MCVGKTIGAAVAGFIGVATMVGGQCAAGPAAVGAGPVGGGTTRPAAVAPRPAAHGTTRHHAPGGTTVRRVDPPAVTDATKIYEFADGNSTADATNRLLQGTVLDYTWSELEPTRGRYDWAIVSRAMRPWVDAGKGVILRVATSGETAWGPSEKEATPSWAYRMGVPGVKESDGAIVPLEWNRSFQPLYEQFVEAFGHRFGPDRSVRMIEMGIGMGGETIVDQEDGPSSARSHLWVGTGYSDAVWLRTIETIADDYRRAFGAKPLIAMVDSSFLDDSGPYYDRLVDWLHQHDFVLQYNGLTSTTSQSPFPDGLEPTVVEQRSPVSKTPGQRLTTEMRIAHRTLDAGVFLMYGSDLQRLDRDGDPAGG